MTSSIFVCSLQNCFNVLMEVVSKVWEKRNNNAIGSAFFSFVGTCLNTLLKSCRKVEMEVAKRREMCHFLRAIKDDGNSIYRACIAIRRIFMFGKCAYCHVPFSPGSCVPVRT